MQTTVAEQIDTTHFRTPPFAHQLAGINALLKHKYFAIFDEPGAGKSKQVIDAACLLAERGEIDTVVVVCPASVRSVWCDVEIGEIKKHSWHGNAVYEFHSKRKQIWYEQKHDNLPTMAWIITNYEFLRNDKHLTNLCKNFFGPKTLLVLDESSYIKSRTAAQTKAVLRLRAHCARVVLLNGTPIVNNPLDLFSQMKVLSQDILGENFWQFRSHYCDMVPMKFGAGPRFSKIVSYKNLDELQRKIAPYCLRRLKSDCLDLPPKLYTQREVALTPESWKRYQELKREAVISLGNGDVRLEQNAAVRIMRLAQLTSGILGGCLTAEPDDPVQCDLSSEKLDWCVQHLREECTASHVIVWCRWRRERERLVEALKEINVYQIYGGQSQKERELAIKVFSGNEKSNVRNILIAQQASGGVGLNLVRATEELFLSNTWSWGQRIQAEDRTHRSGQKSSVLIMDVLATGPRGEKTIDHQIAKALREKEDLATFTCAQWRVALSDT
jgi:SNF2 family DNA or RNA helicase